MTFAGMLECMMAEAAPILLAVELDAVDARGRIILATGEGVPRHDGPGHGQAWRRMVARRTPTRGKTAPPSLSRQFNRVLQNCGRAVIRARLTALQDRFGRGNPSLHVLGLLVL